MIDATMMDMPLTTQMILRRGRRLFADSQVSTFDGERLHTKSFAEIADRAARLASALVGLGIARGERIGTLCWNSHAHLEAYLAVPAAGFVLHTLNLRLHPDQIGWIAAHADDRAIIVDGDLADMLASFVGQLPNLRHVIITGEGDSAALGRANVEVHKLDALIEAHPPMTAWPQPDERAAAAICYTSGTTGNPKGVVYSHRSIFLHSLASLGRDAFGVCNADRVLMMPPMFHANAWGLPYSCWLAGADMIMPSRFLQPAPVAAMIEAARPTLTMTVPTILNDLLARNERQPIDMSSFRAIVAGGSAVSAHLIQRVRSAWGVGLLQGWGMTETSPMCVLSHPPRDSGDQEQTRWRAKSGRPVAGVEVRLVDNQGAPVAEDGEAVGHLQVRGPWVTSSYLALPDATTGDGWFDTGDVGSIDPFGYVQITDRAKDLIKSGGEWISSVDLENALAALPGVAEAAVVAIPHPRWEERPLAIIAWKGPSAPDYARLRSGLHGSMAKFMIPDYWASLSVLPKTSVGKIDKRRLREQVAAGDIEIVQEQSFGAEEC
jgi:fatty-acyl-CoA synthase